MIDALSYVGFRSPSAPDWATFGPDILGAQLVAGGSESEIRLRLDEASWRIAVEPGERDELAYLGWSVGDAAGFDAVVGRVRDAGVEVHVDLALAAARCVEAAGWFVDPFGFRHELGYGLKAATTPFEPGRPIAGFVTGDAGLGHLALVVPDLEVATDFYIGVLGFEHSDDIDMGMMVRFVHCNPRHHSLAFAEVSGMVGVHHLMLEVPSIDDVGCAYDLVIDRGLTVAGTLGRHTNDRMTSFYVRTPSGFDIEYGAGGLLIDTSADWPVGHFGAMSTWGHRPPSEPLFPGILVPVEAAR